ncbi:MAG: hypothetical protein OER98_01175 [Gammaproteobacteria bacterium]|jgi:hypothetical protein|nr:hypothetical protein [Gammaproteobacteria bacterium]
MTPGNQHKSYNSNITLQRLRERVLGGAYILLDTLTEDELAAMQTMLFNDEAEIVNSACKPFLVAKLDKIIIAP